MKIVIDIPKTQYECLAKIAIAGKEPLGYFERVIMRGIPLPEHHGRLIDADALIISLGSSDEDIYCKCVIEEEAPTIIEGGR